jgi:hypothetical protein
MAKRKSNTSLAGDDRHGACGRDRLIVTAWRATTSGGHFY